MMVLLDAVQAALNAARAASSGRDAVGLAPADLVAVADALGVLRRTVDAALLPVAAEIARQSRRELGGDSLAKKQGFGSAGRMIATTTGTSTGEAVRMVAVGEATAPRVMLSGEVAPPVHPHVAAAVGNGAIGTLAAMAIVSMLDRVQPRTDPASLDAMEARLAEAARGLSIEQLRTLIIRGETLLDPDGVEPREEELRADRGVTIRTERSGAIVFNGRFDPETGAPIVAAVEDLVSGMLRRSEDGTSVADTDPRSIKQMRADALSQLCKHMLGCEASPTGVSTTVVVRINLEDLQNETGRDLGHGAGFGIIDGIDQPVSVATVRRMAANANIIPCVLGGDSEILDWGRAKRLFTPAQKLALTERDGGCTFCGAPPSITEAHHIRWWSRDAGPTDLDNGVLLCTTCHHRIHADGWEIRIGGERDRKNSAFRTAGEVWFIPPAWLDASRTPRLGGRARFDLVGASIASGRIAAEAAHAA
ncbi:MAG TPA: DUF222 domain-containing protein [Humibacter sp.]|jgi:5-methylcytosine-specific restriction protein A|nr:DUF222 domain-containing protein [Humibacter sp.]